MLDEAKAELSWAWKTDASWDYPVHTDQVFFEIKEALKLIHSPSNEKGGRKRSKLRLRKILKAVEKAFEIDTIGFERLPKPRIHFLHRRLLELASWIGISDLTHSGILEFLDDLCPCGKQHTPESIRKLRTRVRLRKLRMRNSVSMPT